MTKFKDVAHLYVEYVAVNKKNKRKKYLIIGHAAGDLIGVNQSGSYEVNVNDVLPILRPLSDMTEDEIKTCNNITHDWSYHLIMDNPVWEDFQHVNNSKQFAYLLKQGFDLFDLIPNGEAIDKTKIGK